MELTAASGTQSNENDGSRALWKYVIKLEKMGDNGGNTKFRCTFCNKEFKGSYSRVRAHLLRISRRGIAICTKMTPEILKEIQRTQESTSRSSPPQVPLTPLPLSQSHSVGLVVGGTRSVRMEGYESTKRRKFENSPLAKYFDVEPRETLGNEIARETLESEIARIFYSGGLPFHFARNPYYISSFTLAANNSIPGFVPPGENALRTSLLQKEKVRIENLLQPIRGSWSEKGVSIVAYGWTDSQRRPLINFMAVSESGPIFLKAISCEGEYKDKNLIASLIKETITEVGPQNVVQVMTDNSPLCKSAGILIEAQYPGIFWTPCLLHTLNLALKNICAAKHSDQNDEIYVECHWITEVTEDAMMIRNFITNHSMRLAIYMEFPDLKLLSVAETRFASMIVMLRRLKLMKQTLQEMIICEKWSSYQKDDVVIAQRVKNTLADHVWWEKVEYILSFTAPIYEMLQMANSDKPSLHLIYNMWDSMIEEVKRIIYGHEGKEEKEKSRFHSVVHGILIDRWNKSTSPLLCLAHALNPRYYTHKWLEEDPKRVPPHRDVEISTGRNKCLRRYFPDNEERRAAYLEFARFCGAMDAFATSDSLRDRGDLDPKCWWAVHGASAPMLQGIALKLLGQPCSSSCCERNWKTYSFIHSLRKNKIQSQLAKDLEFVHNNLRLLSRKSEQYMRGDSMMWDVGGNEFDLLDGAGELEIADLSLDEPEMEAMIFTDDNVGDNIIQFEVGSS